MIQINIYGFVALQKILKMAAIVYFVRKSCKMALDGHVSIFFQKKLPQTPYKVTNPRTDGNIKESFA